MKYGNHYPNLGRLFTPILLYLDLGLRQCSFSSGVSTIHVKRLLKFLILLCLATNGAEIPDPVDLNLKWGQVEAHLSPNLTFGSDTSALVFCKAEFEHKNSKPSSLPDLLSEEHVILE